MTENGERNLARSKKKAATKSFISLTPITDGGKFKFTKRDFKVHEPDDDTSIARAQENGRVGNAGESWAVE